ncbi:MAG: hypothetical protein V1846_00330 [Candidatus Komeilibacteria bacterium]
MTERNYFYYSLLTAVVLILLLLTKIVYSSANDLSRFFTIRSVGVEHTLVIFQDAETKYADTIYLPGRGWYSDKPPLLSITAAGIFLLLRSLGILSDPVLASSANANYYILTLIFSGLPLLIFFWLWHRALKKMTLAKRSQNFWLLLGAGGTLLLPFATIFSNHVITALLAFVSFYLIIAKKITSKTLWALGLLVGLLPAIDVPFGFFWLIIITLLIWPQIKKNYWPYLISLIPGIILTLFLNWLTSGNILPMYLVAKQYLSLPQNNWRTDLTIRPPWQIVVDFGQALVGLKKGLFVYTPILLLGFWALLRNTRSLLLGYQRQVLFWGSLIYIFSVIALTNDLGGQSYGLRWALPLVPIWLWAAAEYWPQLSTKSKYIWAIIGLFSVLMSIGGLIDPWQSTQNFTLWNLVASL